MMVIWEFNNDLEVIWADLKDLGMIGDDFGMSLVRLWGDF